jgi:hypothetical protein
MTVIFKYSSSDLNWMDGFLIGSPVPARKNTQIRDEFFCVDFLGKWAMKHEIFTIFKLIQPLFYKICRLKPKKKHSKLKHFHFEMLPDLIGK